MQRGIAELVRVEKSPSGKVALLEFCVAEKFAFREGQFVMLEARGVRRAYSIASPAWMMAEKNLFQTIVKEVEGGELSPFLTGEIAVGDAVARMGPAGHFVLPENPGKILLVSVGSGYSPMHGFLQGFAREFAEGKFEKKVVHIFGERFAADLVVGQQEIFAETAEFVEHRLFLSREENLPAGWVRGRVQLGVADFLSEFDGAVDTALLCGLPAMVDEVRALLLESGWDPARILFEKY
jgi:Flavodoxin reductases (ferredoxin-NADPH reductases) family 1